MGSTREPHKPILLRTCPTENLPNVLALRSISFLFLGGWQWTAASAFFHKVLRNSVVAACRSPPLGALEVRRPFTQVKYSHGWLLKLTWPLPSSLFLPLRFLHSQASRHNGGNCTSQRVQHFNQYQCAGSNKRHSLSMSESSISQPFVTKLPSCVPSPLWVSVATKSSTGWLYFKHLLIYVTAICFACHLACKQCLRLWVLFVNKIKFSDIWKVIFWYLTCYSWSIGWETLSSHPGLKTLGAGMCSFF